MALLFGLVGVGAAGSATEASAKPMERDRTRYCAPYVAEYDRAFRLFVVAETEFGYNHPTTQAKRQQFYRAKLDKNMVGC
jgi:hypothetical protein